MVSAGRGTPLTTPIGAGLTSASGKFERSDPGTPVKIAAGLQVLVCVPEGAVVNRVDAHATIVAPAAETRQL